MILDGIEVAKKIKEKVAKEIKELRAKGIIPHLVVISVGDDPASKIYIKHKIADCNEVGIEITHMHFDYMTTEDLIAQIEILNMSSSVHGILVQLPLPENIDSKKVIEAINPKKDVDCFTEENVGKLWTGNKFLAPCTPAGIIELLKYYRIPLEGKHAVVIGRSNIVGKPMAALLMQEDCTVTVCHSKTENLKYITRTADIIICAVGKPNFLTSEYIEEYDTIFKERYIRMFGEEKYNSIYNKQTIVDVGMHRDENNKLCGDVDCHSVNHIAKHITPVPGGVGPMTRAMLLENMVLAIKAEM